jgi:hypothetical protein
MPGEQASERSRKIYSFKRHGYGGCGKVLVIETEGDWQECTKAPNRKAKEVPWVAYANYEVTSTKHDPIVTKVEISFCERHWVAKSPYTMSSSSASPDDATMDTSNSLVPG